MFRKIDLVIIIVLEKITHAIEQRTGKSNFFLKALLMLIMSLMIVGVGACVRYGLIHDTKHSMIANLTATHPFFSAIIATFGLAAFFFYPTHEKRVRDDIRNGFSHVIANSFIDRLIRISTLFTATTQVCITMIVFVEILFSNASVLSSSNFMLMILDTVFFSILATGLYLYACDPLVKKNVEEELEMR